MLDLLNISWLIPALPLTGSMFVGILLISFNRTINRLTKPVSLVIISCISISTILSLLLFYNHITGVAFPSGINISNLDYDFNIYINSKSSIASLILEFSFLIIMILSLNRLDRRTGYVRYFVGLGLLSSILLSLVFSGEFFNSMFNFL